MIQANAGPDLKSQYKGERFFVLGLSIVGPSIVLPADYCCDQKIYLGGVKNFKTHYKSKGSNLMPAWFVNLLERPGSMCVRNGHEERNQMSFLQDFSSELSSSD